MHTPTYLEQQRAQRRLAAPAFAAPHWRVERATDDLTWLCDGARAVGLLCASQDVFELRCHGPASACPPAAVPAHYHNPAYQGVRIIFTWRLGGRGCGPRVANRLDATAEGDTVVVRSAQQWADGTRARTTLRLRLDPAWGAYVADVDTVLDARRVTSALEFCNVLPAGIGDSRPGRERHPFTYWLHPDGLRRMGKNPLWFCSAGAQDAAGEKRIASGGFIGFGPDAQFNPVVEIVQADPACGATTCDNLQDEHLMALPAEGRHAAATGWFHLEARYRLFSLPEALARDLTGQAKPMNPGAMLAWKFQYPPTPELPADLGRVELPGSPFYGASDWGAPIPWDRPYNGRLWTASPDPRAAIHYDRQAGRARPGSIRLRPAGEPLKFAPASGHTLHTEAGVRYRLSGWIRTRGQARGWLELPEILFRTGDRPVHASAVVGPDTDWTHVEVAFTAQGDEAPFADTVLAADGHGEVWFTDLRLDPLE